MSLEMAIISSSVLNFPTTLTGPKISSVWISDFGSTSVKMVGSMK